MLEKASRVFLLFPGRAAGISEIVNSSTRCCPCWAALFASPFNKGGQKT